MKGQTLILAGMHRSGTSLIASCLADCGIAIGRRLVPPNARNPRGFFEDEDFLKFHDSLLERRGLPVLLDRNLSFTPSAEETRIACHLIAEREGLDFWGWKEPRTTLFLSFWQELLPQARVLVLYRNPLDVWLSLLRAGDAGSLTLAGGVGAWNTYNRAALVHAARWPDRVLVAAIDGVVAQPALFAQHFEQFTGLPAQRLLAAFQKRFAQTEFHGSAGAHGANLLNERFPDAVRTLDELDRRSSLPMPRQVKPNTLLDPLLAHVAAIESCVGALDAQQAETRRWAESAEGNLAIARQALAEAKAWAERTEKALADECQLSAKNQLWAERTEGLLASERQVSAERLAWAERTEGMLVAERQVSAERLAWAERTERLLAEERKLTAELRARLERAENSLATQRTPERESR